MLSGFCDPLSCAQNLTIQNESRELFVELGYQIARAMISVGLLTQGDNAGRIYDSGISVLEHGCRLMCDLGIFRSLNGYFYDPFMPLAMVRDHLRHVPTAWSCYTFEHIIGIFLSTAEGGGGGGGGEKLSKDRSPFDAVDEYQQVMSDFVGSGYATHGPLGFIWTDKIAPIMIAEQIWSADGISFDELHRIEVQETAAKMWNALSLSDQNELAVWLERHGNVALIRHLFGRWDGTTFATQPSQSYINTTILRIDVAKEIGRRLRGNRQTLLI